MIHDKLVRAAERMMQEIESVCDPTSGHPPLSDPKNPWYEDYNALKSALAELEAEYSHPAYLAVVGEAGDELMNNLDISPDAEFDLETQFTHSIHELENEHPWVLNDDKAILILQYSNHPSAEPANYGDSGCLKGINSNDDFPWRGLASVAFAEDVKQYIYMIYKIEIVNNESLLKALTPA
jgi:hypothetical protein